MARTAPVLLSVVSAALCWSLSLADFAATADAAARVGAAMTEVTALADAAGSFGLKGEQLALDSRMTYDDFFNQWHASFKFTGEQRPGVSREAMKVEFNNTLHPRVTSLLQKSLGGSISVYAERTDADYGTCGKRPALTMADVKDLALQSFNLTDFQPSIPPCNNTSQIVACNYDSGKCCQRPQVEFLERYYDNALVAMALGATKDEAFASLKHARSLAFTLEACDPSLNRHGNFKENDLKFQSVSEDLQPTTETWDGWGLSMIALPPSYEALYELYNAMLIERVRSRQATVIPTPEQMKTLQERVYYKKLAARVVYMDLDLDEELTFPSADDFLAAGLTMSTSSRIQVPDPTSSGSTEDHDVEIAVHNSDEDISVFEESSGSTQILNMPICNEQLAQNHFFQFQISDTVFHKYEACCAIECNFAALYGGFFSSSSNCCAGCSRASCLPNTASVSHSFASVSAIESPSKANAGASVITMTV